MKKALALPLVLSVWMAYAQTGNIVGQVTADKQPLPYAVVALLKTSYSTQTDTLGNYALTNIPEGKYQLQLSFVGYENYQTEVVVNKNTPVTVSADLLPLDAKLKEIVVTGSLKEVSKLQSTTPVDVYSYKHFQRNPTDNLFDALQNVNGLFADIDNGVSNTSDVQINGLEGNYSLFLIDGVPALNGLAGMYALNAFPMSLVDKLEIVKGASSTLYGSEAIAGVINIKTKDPAKAPRFAANVSLTSMLEADADLSATVKAKRVNGLFAVSAQSFNYRWDINKDNFLDVPLTNRASFYNKWAFKRKDGKLAAVYGRYLFEDRFGGEKDVPSQWRGNNRYYTEAVTTHQWQAGLQYQFPLAEKLLLMLDYSGNKQDGNYGFHEYQGVQQAAFAQLSWSKQIDKVNELLMGASYRLQYFDDNTTLSREEITGYKTIAHIGGLFMEDELSIRKWHKLVLGCRFDYSTNAGPVITPRANYKWTSKDNNNVLRAGIGTGYRTPNVVNEGFGAMNGSRTVVIEEKLKPEYAITGTLNYTRVQSLKAGILNIDAGVFYTRFLNFVEPDYDTDPASIIYANSKGATATGFNAYADFTFSYPLKVGVGFTYVRTFELEENEDGKIEHVTPPHIPPFTANFYLSYNFPGPQLSIDWTGNLVTPMNLVTVPNDYRSSKSPVYTIQNIQLTKKFSNGLEIYLGLKNFFNFIQKDPILRPFDPYNRFILVDNPNNYRFDTTYGFTSTQGIKAFAGLRYILP
ncbi:MAG: TonB-dependent receptor [Chitinophagales bacterium]